MNYLLRIIFISLPLLFFLSELSAQDRYITLDECVSIALQNHSAKFQSIEDYKINIAEYKIARAKRSIIIDGQIRTIETDKDDDDTSSSYSLPGVDTYIGLYGGLAMSYNLVDEKSSREVEVARVKVDMSKVNSEKTVQSIILEVKKAYFGYLLSNRSYEVQKEIHKKYVVKSELAKKLFNNGSRPILDVSKSEVDMANSQLEFNKAENDRNKMKRNLFLSMGLEYDDTMNIIPADIDELPLPEKNLDDLYILSDIYNPSIRLSRLEKKIARLKIDAEKAAHLPKVNLSLGLGYKIEQFHGSEDFNKNFDANEWSPVVYGLFTATLPLYRGGGISSMVDATISYYNKAIYKEKEVKANIKALIKENFQGLSDIRKQIEVSNLVIKNAERHLLLAQRSYENGAGSLLDLQDAELSVSKAKMGAIEYKYNYFLTLARLSSLAGVKEEVICKIKRK